ncbi:hypothetical protein ACFQ5N_12920 [Lutibacter holmesii]|uniref:PepSY domain-containing protein n=1 Tax=Lutibacter holmesii TaxID=1137985 RepID=A0ABW3WRB3_9FLAO
MKNKMSTSLLFRVIHRYLGFFLAGIMTVYALSGIVLIFRDTDLFKVEKQIEKKFEPNTEIAQIGKKLRIRNIKITKTEGDIVYFNNGKYNKKTGNLKYTSNDLPFIIGKFAHLHKAKSGEPLFFLNVFFGVSLLFFAVSSFFMFIPKSKYFKKGMYYAIAGLVLTIILLFV